MKKCNCNGSCGSNCKCKDPDLIVWAGKMSTFKYHGKEREGTPIHIDQDDITMAFLTKSNEIAIVDIKRKNVLRSSLDSLVTQKLQEFLDGIQCEYHVTDSKKEIRQKLEKAWAESLQKLHDRDKFLEKQKKEPAA